MPLNKTMKTMKTSTNIPVDTSSQNIPSSEERSPSSVTLPAANGSLRQSRTSKSKGKKEGKLRRGVQRGVQWVKNKLPGKKKEKDKSHETKAAKSLNKIDTINTNNDNAQINVTGNVSGSRTKVQENNNKTEKPIKTNPKLEAKRNETNKIINNMKEALNSMLDEAYEAGILNFLEAKRIIFSQIKEEYRKVLGEDHESAYKEDAQKVLDEVLGVFFNEKSRELEEREEIFQENLKEIHSLEKRKSNVEKKLEETKTSLEEWKQEALSTLKKEQEKKESSLKEAEEKRDKKLGVKKGEIGSFKAKLEAYEKKGFFGKALYDLKSRFSLFGGEMPIKEIRENLAKAESALKTVHIKHDQEIVRLKGELSSLKPLYIKHNQEVIPLRSLYIKKDKEFIPLSSSNVKNGQEIVNLKPLYVEDNQEMFLLKGELSSLKMRQEIEIEEAFTSRTAEKEMAAEGTTKRLEGRIHRLKVSSAKNSAHIAQYRKFIISQAEKLKIKHDKNDIKSLQSQIQEKLLET